MVMRGKEGLQPPVFFLVFFSNPNVKGSAAREDAVMVRNYRIAGIMMACGEDDGCRWAARGNHVQPQSVCCGGVCFSSKLWVQWSRSIRTDTCTKTCARTVPTMENVCSKNTKTFTIFFILVNVLDCQWMLPLIFVAQLLVSPTSDETTKNKTQLAGLSATMLRKNPKNDEPWSWQCQSPPQPQSHPHVASLWQRHKGTSCRPS